MLQVPSSTFWEFYLSKVIAEALFLFWEADKSCCGSELLTAQTPSLKWSPSPPPLTLRKRSTRLFHPGLTAVTACIRVSDAAARLPTGRREHAAATHFWSRLEGSVVWGPGSEELEPCRIGLFRTNRMTHLTLCCVYVLIYCLCLIVGFTVFLQLFGTSVNICRFF